MSKINVLKIMESSNCFVTGLPIKAPQKWREVEVVKNYYVSFALIGENILLTSPRGNCGLEGIPKFWDLREKFMVEMGIRGKPYVEIKDYSRIPSVVPQKARLQFTDLVVEESKGDDLKALIPFNASILTRIAFNLGAKLVKVGMQLNLAENYEMAVRKAVQCLNSWNINLFRETRTLPVQGIGTIRLGDDLVVIFKLYGDEVLYSEFRGMLQHEHLDKFFEEFEKILTGAGLVEKGYCYRIINYQHLRPIHGNTYKKHNQLVRELQKKCTFRHSVYHNVSPFMLNIINISKRFVSTQITIVDSFDTALESINKLKLEDIKEVSRTESIRRPWLRKRKQKKLYSHEEVESMCTGLLEYIASVDWTTAGVPDIPKSDDNPLSETFHAIKFIKEDYDNLAEEKDKMYLQLVQSSKMASLGVLGAGVAHELNNPLAAILGFASLIQRSTKESKTANAADKIEQASTRMHTIVSHLVDFSRESKKVDWRETYINTVIEDSLVILSAQLLANDITVNIDKNEADCPIWADAIQLESVFQNLIVNSKDAFLTYDGNEEKIISINIEKRNKGLLVRYRDNAGGMSEEVAKKIFDPFFTTKDVGAGTGLGMSVSHGIISRHKGTITVESVEGKGTEFQIFLPFGERLERLLVEDK